VVLVGHSGTGKSSLVEALLAATGTIQRTGSIQEGTTVSDFDETEVRQQRSVNLTLAPVIHNGIKVNLLDTPGYADFTGDLRAGLRAADSALFAVSATDGIDGVTRMLWEECAAVGMPRATSRAKLGPDSAHRRGWSARGRTSSSTPIMVFELSSSIPFDALTTSGLPSISGATEVITERRTWEGTTHSTVVLPPTTSRRSADGIRL